MYIAQSKRKENIAEYILYLWQLEDLLRALQFSPEAVYSQLVQKQERLSEQQKQQALVWYMELAGLLREEGKEQSGHLEHTMHLIADLDNLHRQLLTLPAGENYRRLYGAVAPELPGLKSKLGKPGMSDVELFFRALYAVMLYRIKGDRSKQGYIDDVIGLISPVVAELATMFRRIERGEVERRRSIDESLGDADDRAQQSKRGAERKNEGKTEGCRCDAQHEIRFLCPRFEDGMGARMNGAFARSPFPFAFAVRGFGHAARFALNRNIELCFIHRIRAAVRSIALHRRERSIRLL